MKNWRLLNSLKTRGLNTGALARAIGSGRAHVSQVLNNVPGRGGQTRRKLAPLLTAEELALAGWDREGVRSAECEVRSEGGVPRGTLFQGNRTNGTDVTNEDLTPGRTACVGQAPEVERAASEAGWESASGEISQVQQPNQTTNENEE